MKRKTFTLVELLLVISIIALLAGLILPVIGKVKDNAKKLKAKSEANALVLAIKSYESTYGLLPWHSGNSSVTTTNPAIDACWWNWTTAGTDTPKTRYDTLMQILTQVNISGYTFPLANSRAIKFLDAPAGFSDPIVDTVGKEKGSFRDPWGNRYGIAMDLDYTNKIDSSGEAVDNILQGSVFVWSFGPPQKGKLVSENSFGSSTSPYCNVATWQ